MAPAFALLLGELGLAPAIAAAFDDEDLGPLGHPDHLRVLLAWSTRRPCLAPSIIARGSLFPSAQGVPFQVAMGSLFMLPLPTGTAPGRRGPRSRPSGRPCEGIGCRVVVHVGSFVGGGRLYRSAAAGFPAGRLSPSLVAALGRHLVEGSNLEMLWRGRAVGPAPVAARDTSQPNTNNPGAQPAGGLLPAGPPAEGYFALGGGLRDRGWPPPPAAERRVATGAGGGRIGPMIAEPTYEQVQALAIKLTQNLCKRVVAGGSTLGSTRRVAGTTSEDLRSEGYTDRGRARTRRGPGGLLRGFLSALGPRGCHPLGNRLLLFGRHRSALPRRLGVGRGLRDRGGRSRRPPRGGAPSRGLRRSGGPEHLVDVVQRLDFRLQALDLTLAVGDCLCYNTHKFSQGLYRPSLDAL